MVTLVALRGSHTPPPHCPSGSDLGDHLLHAELEATMKSPFCFPMADPPLPGRMDEVEVEEEVEVEVKALKSV